jgi:hypothetical protein
VESLPSKRRILKKRETKGAMIEKKREETSYEEAPCFKKEKRKKVDEIYKLLGEILSKERKEITFSDSAKSDVWPHPNPHIICICTTFSSLTFFFLTPTHYTILHQLIIYHTNSLKFSFTFYNIQGVAYVHLESEPPQKY